MTNWSNFGMQKMISFRMTRLFQPISHRRDFHVFLSKHHVASNGILSSIPNSNHNHIIKTSLPSTFKLLQVHSEVQKYNSHKRLDNLWNDYIYRRMAIIFGCGAMLMYSCSTSATKLEEDQTREQAEENTITPSYKIEAPEQDDEWIETDWSDLPPDDQDKETSCFICLVNREGPCRNYWRRFEKCMDENPGEDEEGNSLSTKACEKPFYAWMRCQQKYREYYTERAEKVEYQLWTDDVRDLEDNRDRKKFPTTLRPKISLDDVSDADNDKSYHVIIPMENKSGDSLVIGYVKNQRGKLLGFGSKKKLLDQETPGKIQFSGVSDNEKISINAVYEGDDAPIYCSEQRLRNIRLERKA